MKSFILATAALLAAPVMAQPAASQTAPAAQSQQQDGSRARMMRPGSKGHMRHGRMFAGMSADGQKLILNAMRSSPEDRAAVKAARDKIAGLLGADKLDSKALKSAMDEERRTVDAQHARQQQRLLDALGKLSVQDRKAFAAATQKARTEMRNRTAQWRARASQAAATK